MSGKVESLADIKKRRERVQYKSLVLETWDRFEHAEKRDQSERRADVERAARQRL